tara:strand:- start:3108 stop:3650 length:543 start_codon:yes stop_codon:yes gene_type:complete
METLTQKLQNDPHIGKPIPGQSLTATPGSMPYENPPQTSSVENAFLALKAGLYQEKTQREIGEVTKAGISCETLASSLVMMGFSQGIFNPDVAELIRPFLTVEIFKIAKSQGVDKVILENKPMRKSLDMNALRDLGDEALPNNRFDIKFTPEEEELMKSPSPQEELPESEGFMTKPREVA